MGGPPEHKGNHNHDEPLEASFPAEPHFERQQNGLYGFDHTVFTAWPLLLSFEFLCETQKLVRYFLAFPAQ